MNELIREFCTHQRRRHLAESTIELRARNLRSFERWLERPLVEATGEDVERFLDGRPGRTGSRLSARTRYCWVSHLHMFYEWAWRAGHVDVDPTLVVGRPELPKNLPRPIRDDDLAEAIAQAEPVMRAWLWLAAYGGLRCFEIAGLQRDDVFEGEGLVRVVGKRRRERIIPLHPLVWTALRSAGLPRTGHLFLREDGTPFPAARVSRRIAVYLDDLGIDATAHQLRHWFGSRTYQQCRDIRVVQELLGHSSPTTTAIYTAFSTSTMAKAVATLPTFG